MPQFKIAKTDNIEKLNDNKFIEDKLYIYKETNKLGRLFYDFDNDTRIEIGLSNDVYRCSTNLSDDICKININDLTKYSTNNDLTTVYEYEIQINSLVISSQSLYVIKDIDRLSIPTQITVKRIYVQKDLEWNDYY